MGGVGALDSPWLASRMSKRARTSTTSHLWEAAVVVYTVYVTQRKRDQTQNKTECKEGEYVGDSDDNSSGQQLVHGLGCARQDQRLRHQLPPVRPQGFQVRRCQGEADRVRRGQVQDKEMPGWVKCPDSTWQLLP